MSQQMISRLENGVDLTTKKLPDLARALEVSVYEIDENFTPDDEPLTQVPLISWVSAGDLRGPDAVEDLMLAPRVSVPGLEVGGEWIALRVEGDSMDRISPPGSVIFVNLKDRKKVPNACYVIVDADTGEASYKRFRPNPPRYEPVSTNLTHTPIFVKDGQEPKIIGRVHKSLLSLV